MKEKILSLKELKDYSIKEGITMYEAMVRTNHFKRLEEKYPDLKFLLNYKKI